jgi:hypothetical protein
MYSTRSCRVSASGWAASRTARSERSRR